MTLIFAQLGISEYAKVRILDCELTPYRVSQQIAADNHVVLDIRWAWLCYKSFSDFKSSELKA